LIFLYILFLTKNTQLAKLSLFLIQTSIQNLPGSLRYSKCCKLQQQQQHLPPPQPTNWNPWATTKKQLARAATTTNYKWTNGVFLWLALVSQHRRFSC